MKQYFRSLYYRLPIAVRVWVDSHFNQPTYLNAQAGREMLVRDLFKHMHIDAVVETGTFRGGSTEFFATTFKVPVHSVEIHPGFHAYSVRRLNSLADCHLDLDDSRSFLTRLASDSKFHDKVMLFYLDAHWGSDLPLMEEFQIIAGAWKHFVILVDDFRVPDDPGYSFDCYGPGKTLELETFPGLTEMGMVRFFPSLPSGQETGCKRGCLVLADHETSQAVKLCSTLREWL
jgi:hypothetical protein